MKKGFTLIELLVVIAIIAILAAILFPVFARAREKARQTTCTSNQKQIAASTMMYVQDHEETLPVTASYWSAIAVDPGVLKCPTKGKSLNGYVYNADLSGTSLGDYTNPANVFLTMDGENKNGQTSILKNWISDSDPRHSGKVVESFLDGHVIQADAPWRIADEPTLNLWMKASTLVKNGVKDGDPIATWQDDSTLNRVVEQTNATLRPKLAITGNNGYPAVVFYQNPNRILNVPSITSLSDFTIFTVFKYTPGSYQWDVRLITLGIRKYYTFSVYRKNDSGPDWRTSFSIVSTSPYGAETKASSIADSKVHLIAIRKSGNTQQFYADGLFIDQITGVDTTHTETYNPPSYLSFGGGAATPNDLPGIWLTENVVINKSLSDKDFGMASKEIKERYNL